MPSKKKQQQRVTNPAYEGLIGRVCGILGIMPSMDTADDNLTEKRFLALEAWCNEQQRMKQQAKEAFGE